MPYRPRRRKRPKTRTFGGWAFKIARYMALIIGACALWGFFNRQALNEYWKARAQRNALEKETSALEKAIAQMNKERAQLEKRGFADEVVAREEWKMIKPGEQLVLLEWKEPPPEAVRDALR